MEGKTEKGCFSFHQCWGKWKNPLNVVVDVRTDRLVRESCQLCLLSLAASVEFCQGERSILISTNRKTGIWQRARTPLTPRLHECRRVFAIQVLSSLSCVLDVAVSLFSLWDIMVYRQTCNFVDMAIRFFFFLISEGKWDAHGMWDDNICPQWVQTRINRNHLKADVSLEQLL